MQRFGRRNRPFYRISAIDKRTRRDGRVIEALGWYDPMSGNPERQVALNEPRVRYWLSVGAQPSDTVRDMLAKRQWISVEEWEAERAESRQMVEAKKAAEAAAATANAGKEEKKA